MKAGGVELPTERAVQREILRMIALCFPEPYCIVHHSPNGAHLAGNATARFKQIGALKGDGMRLGWPDLVVHWLGGKTAYIECKRPKLGRVSDEQKARHEALGRIGIPTLIATSSIQAFEFLKNLGAPSNGVEWE